MKLSGECPSATALSAWLDDEPDTATSERTRNHVRECQVCREQALAWVETAHVLRRHPTRSAPPSLAAALRGCLDAETLVAYCDAQLSPPEAVRAEQHLDECSGCVGEVQRLIAVRVAMQETTDAPVASAPPQRIGQVRRRVSPLRSITQWVGNALARPWPAMGMLVATAMLALVIAHLLPVNGTGNEVRYRSIPGTRHVAVIGDDVIAHARPGDDQAAVVTLNQGATAAWLEESNAWTRIQLADGRRVWVRSTQLAPLDGTP